MTRRHRHLHCTTRRPAQAQTGSDPGLLFFLDAVIALLRYVNTLKEI